MHSTWSIAFHSRLRAAALLATVALALAGCDGVGPGLPSDCPPGDDCNGPVTPVPIVEELHPRRGGPAAQRVHVVLHLEEVAAGRAPIDDLEKAVLAGTPVDAGEPCVVAHGRGSIRPTG